MYQIDLPPRKINPQIEAWFLKYSSDSDKVQVPEDDIEYDKKLIINTLRELNYDSKFDLYNTGSREVWFIGRQSKQTLISVAIRSDSFSVAYDANIGFQALYYPQYNGYLEIDAYIQNNQGKRHPLMPHLSELIPLALEYFAKRGQKVYVIAGIWDKPSKNNPLATNYQIYHRALADGLSPEEAAFETATGKVVKKCGFTYLRFKSDPYDRKGICVLFGKTQID